MLIAKWHYSNPIFEFIPIIRDGILQISPIRDIFTKLHERLEPEARTFSETIYPVFASR